MAAPSASVLAFTDALDRLGGRFSKGRPSPEDRAALAQIRRAATDPRAGTQLLAVLGDVLPQADGWAFDAHTLTATLYALHKQHFSQELLPRFPDGAVRTSFGASLRKLRDALGSGQTSLDGRVSALLDTPAEDLAVPLRQLLQRIATAERRIPVHYPVLLSDLLAWSSESTRRRWARDYWQPQTAAAALDLPATESAEESTPA